MLVLPVIAIIVTVLLLLFAVRLLPCYLFVRNWKVLGKKTVVRLASIPLARQVRVVLRISQSSQVSKSTNRAKGDGPVLQASTPPASGAPTDFTQKGGGQSLRPMQSP